MRATRKPGRRSPPPALVVERRGTLAPPRGWSPTLISTPLSPAPATLQNPATPPRRMYPQPRALSLADLPAAIRQQAEFLVRFAPEVADGFVYCAEWLELCLKAHVDERLSIAQGAQESGWSYEGLRKYVADRPELNASASGPPMIRRADLAKLPAPRGPRGAYGPRNAKTAASASAYIEARPHMATASDEGRLEQRSECREPSVDQGADSSCPVSPTSDTLEARSAPAVRHGATGRRPGRPGRGRRRDPGQIFDDLLARTARG